MWTFVYKETYGVSVNLNLADSFIRHGTRQSLEALALEVRLAVQSDVDSLACDKSLATGGELDSHSTRSSAQCVDLYSQTEPGDFVGVTEAKVSDRRQRGRRRRLPPYRGRTRPQARGRGRI